MSKRRDREFLGDIQEAMEMVALYIKGFTYRKFLEDRKTQDAVVRNFEIIGEAAKNVSKDLKLKHPEIEWKSIAGLRDKLIHFYFGIDYKIVWNISRKELPELRKQIRAVLKQEGD
ncbi:MAG: DUF86 domain-containing protein [Nitrospirota bacterium]